MLTDERLKKLASLPDIDGSASEEIQMAYELLSARTRIAALETENREWFDDGESLNKFLSYCCGYHKVTDDFFKDSVFALRKHRALLEKYGKEKK